ILPLVFIIMGRSASIVSLVSIPAMVLLIVNLAWVALLLGTVCARYRDLAQIIGSALQVIFYLTPIIWMPALLTGRRSLYLLDWNPLYHLIEIVRAPLLGALPSAMNWGFSLACAIIGWTVTMLLYGRFRHRIPYWL